MLFHLFLCFLQLRGIKYGNSHIDLFSNDLMCENLIVFLSSNITFLCENVFDYTFQYDNLTIFEINVTKSINFINNSKFEFNDINFADISKKINHKNDIKIIFTDFLNITMIESIIKFFSFLYPNVLITLDWEKYSTNNPNYCQWDISSVSSDFDAIRNQFEELTETFKWKKICINNKAYLHFIREPDKLVCILKYTTKNIIIILIIFILFLLILLYFISLHKYKNLKRKVANEYDQENSSTNDDQEINSFNDDQEISGSNDDQEISITYNEYQKSNNSNNNDDKKNFTKEYFKQFFGIGYSSSSIISEAFDLIKVFQKISSNKCFTIHLTNDGSKLFSWTVNLFEMILSNFYFRFFYGIERFYFINYIFPTILLLFIFFFFCNFKFILFLIFCFLFGILGFGLGYINFNIKISLCFIIPSIVFIAIFIIGYYFMFKNHTNFDFFCLKKRIGLYPFSKTIILSLIIFSLMMLPFFINNMYLVGSYLFICLLILIILFIIESILIFFFHRKNQKLIDKDELKKMNDDEVINYDGFYVENISLLITNILTIFFIPSTNIFFEHICNSKYNNNWICIIGYICFGLSIPIILTLFCVINKNPTICEKYKTNFYIFVELIDLIRQIDYALVSANDVTWACLFIEITWILFIFILRPYINYSEYCLQAGNSSIVFIISIISLIYQYRTGYQISFLSSVAIVIVALILPTLSLYLYFLYDFIQTFDDTEDNSEKAENKRVKINFSINSLYYIKNILPFAFISYGIFIPLIMDHFNTNNKLYKKM